MLRTVIASLGMVVLGAVAASSLTEGFDVWTAEGARRLDVQNQPVATPAAMLDGPGLHGHDLHELLARTGQVTIVDFVYTRCASICASLGSGFQQMQRQLVAQRIDGVRLLSISFDPAHDDTATLALYAERWAADPRRWRFASVPDAPALARLLRAFQVVVVADGQGGYEHNAALLVIDAHGRLVRIFDAAAPDDALSFALALARPLGPV
jgi:protein SCO1/2